MNKRKFSITKSSGEQVIFSKAKLVKSLQNSGASKKDSAEIANEVEGQLFDGMKSKKIYGIAYSLLRQRSRHLAARYHLKAGINELGPSGFPFEKYVAELLRHMDYTVKIGQVVQGHCVSHEVDVIADKNDQHFMIECKYHNSPGVVCDIKIPLYIHARFLDIDKQSEQIPGHSKKFNQGWIVTNTRFTSDALQYGICSGLHLISWDYPVKGSLKDLVDTQGLYPLTCLTSLTKVEKKFLLDNRIVLSKELCENPDWLIKAGIPSARIKIILEESDLLCKKRLEVAK